MLGDWTHIIISRKTTVWARERERERERKKERVCGRKWSMDTRDGERGTLGQKQCRANPSLTMRNRNLMSQRVRKSGSYCALTVDCLTTSASSGVESSEISKVTAVNFGLFVKIITLPVKGVWSVPCVISFIFALAFLCYFSFRRDTDFFWLEGISF